MRSNPARAAAARPGFLQSRQRAYDCVRSGAWSEAAAALAGMAGDRRFDERDSLALATARFRLGDFAAMQAAAGQALAIAPHSLTAVHLLTMSLIYQNRWAEALPLFERHADGPAREQYHFVVNHATTLSQLGRPQEAVAKYLEAMVLEMTDPALHMKLGLALKALKMFEEAAESFLTAHVLDKRRFAAQLMVLHMRQYACAWGEFESGRAGIVEALEAMDTAGEDDGPRGEGAVWALAAIEHPPRLFRKACAQVAHKWLPRATPLPRHALPAPGERRIRVGYVGSDFHSHATTLLMVEVLERRDTDRFEVTLYSHGKNDGSDVQQRVRAACERFVDMTAMSEQQMARQIHADGIDVLVDLKGHTFGNRLGLFAWRPAPVQVSWLGFPGTCGAEYIDYMVGDRFVTPLEHADHYSEQIAQMPHSYQPNDSRRRRLAPGTRAQWGLPEDAVVLGNFNQSFKLSPQTFDAWVRIVQAVPGSVLWLMADNPQASTNLRLEAERRGLDPQRLVFAPRVGVDQHLARLPLADFMLDNWPCNAHTTASDALWSGVPLVTLMGESFASRVAGSLLHAVGLGELACSSVEAYEATAIALASDRPRIAALRRHLDAGRTGFPLFDGARFAGDLEALYLRMVERARAGLPPAALAAAPSIDPPSRPATTVFVQPAAACVAAGEAA
jgi:predicted O-linked N-acetylglucosamine transferase (SPINDLY family)